MAVKPPIHDAAGGPPARLRRRVSRFPGFIMGKMKMSGRVLVAAKRLFPFVAILPAFLSCATMMVSEKASEVHYKYWSITRVQKARISDDELWLLLELKRERSNFTTVAALRIPIREAVWLGDNDGRAGCPDVASWAKAPWVSPPASDLQEPSAFPSFGQEVEVRNLELNTPDDLRQISSTEDPWDVLFVKFNPPEGGAAPKGGWPPVLALVRKGDSGGEGEKCVISTFFVGTANHEGWAYLAPFAIAVDAATLPLQIIALVYWLLAGD